MITAVPDRIVQNVSNCVQAAPGHTPADIAAETTRTQAFQLRLGQYSLIGAV